MGKIAADAAAQELKGLIEEFDADLTADQRSVVLKAIMRGDLSCKDEKFTLRLRRPIELENGKTISELTITEPNAGDLKKANIAGDEFSTALKLLSIITGEPLGVIDRLKSRDASCAGVVLAFFG